LGLKGFVVVVVVVTTIIRWLVLLILENDMGLEATSKERKLNKHRIISIVCIFAF